MLDSDTRILRGNVRLCRRLPATQICFCPDTNNHRQHFLIRHRSILFSLLFLQLLLLPLFIISLSVCYTILYVERYLFPRLDLQILSYRFQYAYLVNFLESTSIVKNEIR